MKLEGYLVDLVTYDQRFIDLEHKWENDEAAFWGDMGDRVILSQRHLTHRREEGQAHVGPVKSVALGIQTKQGQPIGGFFVGRFNPTHRHAMLGAIIGEPDYWGGGYGTDALLLAVDHAFRWFDLRKLWLMTMGLNARVLRQMAKVGFTREVRQREATYADGKLSDVVIFGLLSKEWIGYTAQVERLRLRERAEQIAAGQR